MAETALLAAQRPRMTRANGRRRVGRALEAELDPSAPVWVQRRDLEATIGDADQHAGMARAMAEALGDAYAAIDRLKFEVARGERLAQDLRAGFDAERARRLLAEEQTARARAAHQRALARIQGAKAILNRRGRP